jgi:hypothetical protein
MVLRIFLILLAVNTVAFVARAHASEGTGSGADEIRMMMAAGQGDSLDEPEDDISELADLGARLLKWRFTSKEERDLDRYASERVFSDHGVAVVEDGAAVNLTWRF